MTPGEMSKDRVDQLRQLAIRCLNSYSGGFEELEQLDRDLKSIIRTLSELADSSWTKSLLRQWGQLEIIYALVLADGRRHLNQDEENDVRDIVAGLITEFQSSSSPD